ncbi:MAG: hypothetical protein J6Q48_10540 [Bacteroidaceae bacterium]|nr:hypothetical protein [Bacteroidaceae bacterium]
MPANVDSIGIKISADANAAGKEIDNLVKKLDKLSSALKKVGGKDTTQMAKISATAKKVSKSLEGSSKSLNKYNSTANKTAKKTKTLASAFGTLYANFFWVQRAVKGLSKSVNNAADYMESFNYFTVAFGKIASKWDEEWENYADENARNYSNKFVTTLNETFKKVSGISYDPQSGLLSETGLKNLGLNLKEVTDAAARLGSMMDAVGQSGDTTLATTEAMVKLAGDISSLYNLDYGTAASKIQSVLQGQSRAGYGFGWDTTMAALQSTADKLNLSKPVSEMTQMEKQQLRILTILNQSRVAWGDQANTINAFANQIRLLKNNISEVSMTLGQLLMPILTKILPVVNGLTIAIKRLLAEIAGFFGIKIDYSGQGYQELEDDAYGYSEAAEDAASATKKLKNATLGIDELNINSPNDNSGSGSAGGGIDLTSQIVKATEEYNAIWEEAYQKMENKAEEFAKKISKILEPIKNIFKDIALGDYVKLGSDVTILATELMNYFKNALASVDWYSVGQKIGDFLSGIDWTSILQTLGSVLWEVLISAFELAAGFIDKAPLEACIIAAFGVLTFSGLAPYLLKTISGLLSETVLGTISNLFAGIGAIISGAMIAVSNFVDMFVNGFSWIKEILMVVGIALVAVGAIILGAPALVAGVIAAIVAAVASLVIVIKDNWDTVKEIWGSVAEWFNTYVITPLKFVFTVFSSVIKGTFEDLCLLLRILVSRAMNVVIGIAENAINSVIALINNFIGRINAAIEVLSFLLNTDWSGIDLISNVSFGRVPEYATGGFPEDGLFMANHGELVGGFSNGRTAVANNEQIVNGIEGGVERAVAKVLAPYLADIAKNTRDTADKDMSVQIGDREIAKANQRGSKSLGYALIY